MDPLPFFPYPRVVAGTPYEGALRKWPAHCIRCPDRPCESSELKGVGLCPYGYNFRRLSDGTLVAGIVLEEYSPASPAWKRRRRQQPPVANEDFEAAIALHDALTAEHLAFQRAEMETQKRAVLDAQQFTAEYIKGLRQDILKGLSFVHDYKQINSQIIQNINAIIEKRYGGATLDEKLRRASREEQAIYWAGRFLDEKLNVARFLLRPEWLYLPSECTRFRVHGMVLKYVRIYEPWFERRNISLKLQGSSYGEITANSSACGVIPHTFIDNALKYAPPHSTVEVFLDDMEAGAVFLEVASFGPAIAEGEEREILRPFTRGRAAVQLEEEGAGYGLYISELVAREHLGTGISVEQDRSKPGPGGRFWTTFGVQFPSKAVIL